MSITIYKFNNTFSNASEINIIELSTTSGMTVSHYAGGLKSGEATFGFEFVGSENYIPHIEDVEFCTVIRKKIDFTALGSNQKEIKKTGKDKGSKNYKDFRPRKPYALPPGFKELYRK